jgi:general secretion pathway protein J
MTAPAAPPCHRPTLRRPQRTLGGFTLIEVLVALFIMSIMTTLAWRGIDALLRARDASQAQSERSLRLNSVLGQWEQDLRQLQRTPASTVLRFDGTALRMTRRSSDGLRVVVWTLQEGALWRWTSPALVSMQDVQTTWARAQQWSVLRGQALRVLDDVPAWQVFYYRSGDNSWSNAQSSGSKASSAASAASSAEDETDEDVDLDEDELVPAGVRLVLTLPQGKLQRDLRIPPSL